MKREVKYGENSRIDILLSDYYSSDEIRAWLYARHPQLKGQRAIDLIHEDQSEEVLNILDRLDSDAYL